MKRLINRRFSMSDFHQILGACPIVAGVGNRGAECTSVPFGTQGGPFCISDRIFFDVLPTAIRSAVKWSLLKCR